MGADADRPSPAAIASPGANSVPHLEKMHDLIPDDAVLSAFYGYVPHFDHREEIYMFPNPFKGSYWGTFKQEGQRLPQADRVEYILVPTILDPSRRRCSTRCGATSRRSTRRAT